MAFDLIVHTGALITVNPAFEIIESGMVCIKNGRIEQIEANPVSLPLPNADEIIDAKGGIIMPGLVNTHTHLPMTLFRGLADDLPLVVWLNETIFPAEIDHITSDSVHWSTLLACAEMLMSGITTCCDGYFLEDEVAAAVSQIGIRAVLGQGVIDFPAPGVADPVKNIAIAREFVQQWEQRTQLITPSIFCHSPYTCSEKTLINAKTLTEEHGVLFQIHAAETRNEWNQLKAERASSPIGFLDRIGVLDQNTLLVHCIWVSDDDIGIIADRGAGVAHCPESNMKLASGISPVPKLLETGITVGLGTDGCASNNNLDLFHEMDIAAKLHKAHTFEPTIMDAATVLKMATIEGARAIGLDRKIGSLEIGKQADLIVLDTRKPHLVPMYHPASHIVYAAAASDVNDVVVSGNILVKDRKMVAIDLDRIMDKVNEIAFTVRI
jgi:5-methylthioadenosine/S-adenosylhomocysteine deaminase